MINPSKENFPLQSIKFGYYLIKVMLKPMNRMSQIIELHLESAYVLVYKELKL